MIVLAVQQGISSLPPTSGQSFSYEFDSELSTYVATEQLGPTSFRSPQILAPGHLSLRLATSYFTLDDDFGPIDYKVSGPGYPDPEGFCTRFGVNASARVGLINLAANYGVLERVEVNFNLPIVITDSEAKEVFYNLSAGGSASDVVDPRPCATFQSEVDSGQLVRESRDFSDIELGSGSKVDFQDGLNAGVGRISIGAKTVLYSNERYQLAFSPEFFFPSPNEDELAGSDSAAILPRLVGQMKVTEWLRMHADIGYDYDFDQAELRRLTWNSGASVPFILIGMPVTIDFGVGGSEFDEGIEWTPSHATFTGSDGTETRFRSLGNNELGTSFVDFLGGIKFRLGRRVVVSGAVNVPLNDEGFRAVAVGTLGLEVYL